MRLLPCPDAVVDLGARTARVRLSGGNGAGLTAPALLASCGETGKVLAFGSDAEELRRSGRTRVRFVQPFEAGLPHDPQAATSLLRQVIQRACGLRHLAKPRLAAAAPSRTTDVQRYALREVLYLAGARRAQMVPAPLAAAAGAGLPVDSLQAVAVAEIGATRTDVAVISGGGLVCAHTVPVGGNAFDLAIVQHLRQTENLLVSEESAEWVKRQIGTLHPRGKQRTRQVLVHGRDIATGLPRGAVLTAAALEPALRGPAAQVASAVHQALVECPPEPAADLCSSGVVLTGGGATLRGLATVVRETVGIPARVADNAPDAVVTGLADYLHREPPRSFTLTGRPSGGLLTGPVRL